MVSGPTSDPWLSQVGSAGLATAILRSGTSIGGNQTRGFPSLQSFPPQANSTWPSPSISRGAPHCQRVASWVASCVEQSLSSLEAGSGGGKGEEQTPVPGLQVPGSWHWSGAEQTTGVAPVQVPA